jgi:glycerol kinase
MQYIGSIDQGTTSTRFIIFDKQGNMISVGQKEHAQIYPQAGWVEHDATEIWQNTQEVIGLALGKVNLSPHDLAAVGITNQRETTVIWNKHTGEPYYNALVWQDTRVGNTVAELEASRGANCFREKQDYL